jgi:putative transposase
LNDRGIFFVIRHKRNATDRVIERRDVDKAKGLTCDQTILITGTKASACPIPLRRIGYRGPQTGKHHVFVTNNFRLAAKTIADIYKSRLQIKLFLKCIKQNVKIKSFVGTSKNAVLTQIWVAMRAYLLLAWIKFASRIDRSLQQTIRLLQLNLFERRDLLQLLKGVTPELPEEPRQIQLRLALEFMGQQ